VLLLRKNFLRSFILVSDVIRALIMKVRFGLMSNKFTRSFQKCKLSMVLISIFLINITIFYT
jgi:hypothetical protein